MGSFYNDCLLIWTAQLGGQRSPYFTTITFHFLVLYHALKIDCVFPNPHNGPWPSHLCPSPLLLLSSFFEPLPDLVLQWSLKKEMSAKDRPNTVV